MCYDCMRDKGCNVYSLTFCVLCKISSEVINVNCGF